MAPVLYRPLPIGSALLEDRRRNLLEERAAAGEAAHVIKCPFIDGGTRRIGLSVGGGVLMWLCRSAAVVSLARWVPINAEPAAVVTPEALDGAYRCFVPSGALVTWQVKRSKRIDELLDAHARVGGQGPGRRWRTSQLNHALVLLLAAELQGFARELHDLGSSTFALWAAPGNQPLERVLKARLTDGRQLDRGNAQPGSLGSDFGRLGFSLWPAMAARDPLTAARQAHLEKLNDARNAIAHADEGQLAKLRAEGFPMTLATFKVWRRSMDGLARTLDVEVAAQLGQLFGLTKPW